MDGKTHGVYFALVTAVTQMVIETSDMHVW